MATTINGHTLTKTEWGAVEWLQDWLRINGGDSVSDPNTSPRGDGGWHRLDVIFPRNAAPAWADAQRQAIRRLHGLGVLKAYEIAYHGDCVKAVPAHDVPMAEIEAARNTI